MIDLTAASPKAERAIAKWRKAHPEEAAKFLLDATQDVAKKVTDQAGVAGGAVTSTSSETKIAAEEGTHNFEQYWF